MNKRQKETIENVVGRLKKIDAGASTRAIGPDAESINAAIAVLRMHGYGVMDRLYFDTWIISALELCISESAFDQNLARVLSRN